METHCTVLEEDVEVDLEEGVEEALDSEAVRPHGPMEEGADCQGVRITGTQRRQVIGEPHTQHTQNLN